VTHRLIVNIRGANASGKTTLARQFIAHAEARLPIDLGPMAGAPVSGCLLTLPQLRRRVFLLGKYDDSKYSGCDKIKVADAIAEAVRYLAIHRDCHVLFEGFRVSKSYTRYAALRNELVKARPALSPDLEPARWLWVFMHAPDEVIFARSEARREDASRPIDKKELAAVQRVVNNTRDKVRAAFPGEHLTLRPESWSPVMLYDRLIHEMELRERGESGGAV
jgi:hypothetical protein